MKLDQIEDIRDAYKWFKTTLPPVQNYLEIGVCSGGSLVACIQSLNPKSVTLCDTWGVVAGGVGLGAEGAHSHIGSVLKNCGYSGLVKFVDGDSRLTLQTLPSFSYDLILVDGDHSLEVATMDLNQAWRLLQPGGTILFDDLDHVQHPYLRNVWTNFLDRKGIAFHHTTKPNSRTYGCGIARKL